MTERQYEGTERRKSVLTPKDKEELVEAITNKLLNEAPEKLWGTLYTRAGKGSFKLAFALMRYGAVIWVTTHWEMLTNFFRPKG